MSKLWGGRFTQAIHPAAKTLSYSLTVDSRLVHYDIQVNMAHAKGLVRAGVFSQSESDQVVTCLLDLDRQFKQDPNALLADDEDIHSCIERLVTESLGDLGKRLHTGKSRNDQVLTDVRLYVKDQSQALCQALVRLIKHLWIFASEHDSVIFPGMTHFQPAQPVLFAHHLLAYIEQFSRDIKRFEQVIEASDFCPLGSGALAGNNYAIDREWVAKELGFSSVTLNSMDAVSDRDFVIDCCAAISLTMTHLSRLSEELVLWSSPLIGFISIGDQFTTGSSIMPQKKNPDMAELIRGKSARVVGHLMSLFQLLKALPLTYNRDLQEDKEPLFDSVDTLLVCLDCMTDMIPTISLHSHAIDDALKKGYLLATEFADYLVGKNIPFRQAHDITGRVVLYAIEHKKGIESLSLTEFHQFSKIIDDDVYNHLTLSAAVDAKNSIGGAARNQVMSQLKRIGGYYQWNKH